MLKNYPLYAGAALLSLSLWACRKERPASPVSDHTYKPMTAMAAPAALFEPNGMDWRDIIQGYDDVDTRRRHAKTFLALGLAEVVKDPEIAAWIQNEAPQHEDEVFSFEELFARYPDAKTIVESTKDPLGAYTGWTFEAVQEQMQYDDYKIKASIYVASFEGLDPSLKPVVTTGEDIGEDEATGSDKVFALYIDKANQVTKVSIWPEVSLAARAPIFAIDGRATNIHELYDQPGPVTPMTPMGGDPQPGTPPSDDLNVRIAISKLQIGYRYDNTSKSEVEMIGAMIWKPVANSTAGVGKRIFLRESCTAGRTEHVRLKDVPQNDANNWVVNSIDRFFCWMHDDQTTPFSWYYGEYDHNYVTDPSSSLGYSFQPRKILFFNTYEIDAALYTSNKPLSPSSVNGVSLNLKGKMGNYNEWYQFDPAAGQNVWWNQYAMRLHWTMSAITPGNQWTKDLWTNPVKGMLQFKATGFCTY